MYTCALLQHTASARARACAGALSMLKHKAPPSTYLGEQAAGFVGVEPAAKNDTVEAGGELSTTYVSLHQELLFAQAESAEWKPTRAT